MKYLFVTAILLMIGGCATSYQPHSFSGGYSHTQVSDNGFIVNFAGNGYTGKRATINYALRRCAEITLEHEFRYFQIVATDTIADVSATASAFITKPSSSNTILCSKEKPIGFHYDAQKIVDGYKISREVVNRE